MSNYIAHTLQAVLEQNVVTQKTGYWPSSYGWHGNGWATKKKIFPVLQGHHKGV